MSHLSGERQKLRQDAIITLFEIDATDAGQGMLRFTPEPVDGGPANFDSEQYAPIPVAASGFQWSGEGAMPRPTLSVSGLSVSFLSLIISTDDLIGLPIKRIRTYRKHLDDGSDPDSDAVFPVDHYVFEQKSKQTASEIHFTLSAAIDQQGQKIPARQVIRDTCTHIYRTWDPDKEKFDYTHATCPYVKSQYFDRSGASVSEAENDVCGKRLSDCRLRFGKHGNLPTRAFPGVGQVK